MTTIKIDRTTYMTDRGPQITGAELRRIAHVDEDEDLWLVSSEVADLRVDPDTTITLMDGLRFFTAPRYING